MTLWVKYLKILAWVAKMERRQDILLGLLFTGLGLTIAILARSYSGASGLYPSVLGGIMALIGGLIAIRSFVSGNQTVRVLAPEPAKLILSASACIVYASLVMPLGFYTASVLLMLLLPFVLGFRQPIYLGLMTLGFMCLIYVVFTILLEKPLPAEFWSNTRLESL